MNKIKLQMALFLICIGTAFAQAPLPSFYDFQNFTSGANIPSGWTTNISGTFQYTTGQVGAAGRLDATGEYVQIYTANPMGAVTYYIKGFLASGSWTGTFTVEESVNGSSWTPLITYVNNLNSSAWTQQTVNPNSASRYLRFYFTNKVSGYNVGLDEVNIPMGTITTQEINIKQNTTTIFSGGSTAYFGTPVGTPTILNLTVENLGSVNTLNLLSSSITGVAAAEYTVSAPALPTTVSPSSNIALSITFNPIQSGTRNATLTLTSDDADEPSYVVNLLGVGGNLATEPTASPSALNFNNVKSYRMNGSFTGTAPAPGGYLVIRKISGSPITDLPVDGTSYGIGDAVGSSKVIYNGSATAFTVNHVVAGTTYQFAVFAYNGNGTFTNYLTSSSLLGSNNSSGSMMPPTEYSTISTAAASFIQDLTNKINPHSSVFYGFYDETMIRLFARRDTSNGQKVVTCVYSGEQYVYTEPFDWSYLSREHTYCHSWMPTFPADGSGGAPNNVERPEYNDQHHLFPAEFQNTNQVRSNFPLGEVINVSGTYLGAKWGFDANNKFVFEPRDEHKGDAARALFYMATCYNNKNDAFGNPQNWKFKNPISGTIQYGQDQNVLKAWHYQDLPDAWEIARNDFLDSLQGNRNPFIDSVQYACYIDFSNMTKIAAPGLPCNTSVGISKNENPVFDFTVFPNPNEGEFSFLFNGTSSSNFEIAVEDVNGKNCYNEKVTSKNNMFFKTLNLQLNSGVYFVKVKSEGKMAVKKMIVGK